MVQGREPLVSPDTQRKAHVIGLCMSPKYKGELNSFQLRNANYRPDQNSAIRIEGIDPDATITEIFAAILEDKVFSSSYIPKQVPYPTAAANVSFMIVRATNAIIWRSMHQGVYIRGQQLRVFPNCNKCKEFEGAHYENVFRVLNIRGPAVLLTAWEVFYWLRKWLYFVPVDVQEAFDGSRMVLISIMLESIYGQSRQAKRCFEEN